MNKLEKIKTTAVELDNVTELEESEEVIDEAKTKKDNKFFSFFTFWKKMSDEEGEEHDILESEEDSPKSSFVIRFLNKRTTVLAACVLIIAIAGYINVRFSAPGDNLKENLVDEGVENTLLSGSAVDNEVGGDVLVETSEDYFAMAVINRERVRDEAIEMLKDVTDSDVTDISAKNQAYAEMTRMANEIASEANIESLVKAKGFAECVAVISGDSANVIVETEGLSINEVAQIKEIVYLECGVLPDDIKIIEKESI